MKQAKIVLLVLSAQEGNSVALDQLYRYFNPKMRTFALTLVPRAQVDDVLQIVWLKMLKRVQILKDPEVFASWLYRSIRWQANDWHKQAYNRNIDKSKTEEALTLVAYVECQNGGRLSSGDASDNDDAFTIALAKLSQIEQQVIHIYYLQEMQIGQIALALEIPTGTVKSRLHRARTTLKQLLEKQNGQRSKL